MSDPSLFNHLEQIEAIVHDAMAIMIRDQIAPQDAIEFADRIGSECLLSETCEKEYYNSTWAAKLIAARDEALVERIIGATDMTPVMAEIAREAASRKE